MYLFFSHYLKWHYGTALNDYVRLVKNFQWFIIHFFSIPKLATSIFAPYKRITEINSDRFNLESWLTTIVINLLSRLIGTVIRLSLIISGLLALVLTSFVGMVGYLFWLGAPAIIGLVYIFGLYLIINL